MPYKALKTRLHLTLEQLRCLRFLMRESKSLYDQALYNVRQHFFQTKQHLTFEDNYQLLKDSEHYHVLNSSQAQMVLRKVDEAMKAFFGSLRSKVKQKVRLPHYLKKDAYYPLFDRMVYKPKQETYTLPRSNFIKRISHELEMGSEKVRKITEELSEIESLFLDIKTPPCIQTKPIKESTLRNLTMGIDFGYNNLAFCSVTNNEHLLIDGKRLKSMNQHYHKQIAKLASR